ncbi:hypothetical protein [Allobranchiibius sp. GilTou38]|uniref:hypothetical protein n=1 Tax=Allobranchiibius sp. GilTou38 TaxID=2815210 RepID=UPI001AA0E9D6|nr:hypothetical protein [Allobranchiibius sp. GilTou38]MBO1768531.1 hypothetical protein [Allobranchiibius sp. GilTou38]
MSTTITKYATRAGAVAGIGAAGLLALSGAASAAGHAGTVHTHGSPLTARASASTSARSTGSYANGAKVTISCQTNGSKVTGIYGTSTLWDKVGKGYVSDTYVKTGSDGRVAPQCGKTPAPPTSTKGCSTKGLNDPHSCGAAVAWAKAHLGRSSSDYAHRCDHVVALAYGFGASGSQSANSHWAAIPGKYKHSGDTTVPAGGLAFFHSSSFGHVMISLGGGKFASNDIHGNGTYTTTTIAEIKSKWGEHYVGWAQPWFQANH